MTLGLIDAGAYIPYYRLARQEMGRAWRLEQAAALLIGERSVAGYDEDTITMAVEATLHALGPAAEPPVDALYFASTSPPFGEKSSAAVVAAACDLPVRRTLDVTGSLRAGTSALAAAFDAVRAGSIRQAVIAAADMRRPEPGSLLETISGDGAAAVIVGTGSEVRAELVGQYHLSEPTIDIWRRADDRYLQTDDEAFTQQVGYFALVEAAIEGLLAETGVAPATLKGIAAYAPDGRAYRRLAKQSSLAAAFARMGRAGPGQDLLMKAGNLGAAFSLAQLALLLETAQPGDLLALIGYGDGADAYLFRVTGAIKKRPARPPVQRWLESKDDMPSYSLALHFRQNLKAKALFPPDVEPWTSLPLLHRERDELLRFRARRCRQCGAVWWPRRPNCYDCGAQVNFESIHLSRRGTVASFVAEWAVPSPLPPVGMITVDTPEGARITTPSTDGDPRLLTIGDEVEFALRIFHTARQLPHYGWKARKARTGYGSNS